MAVSDFVNLCEAWSQQSRLAPPSLEAALDGELSFHFIWQGVVVDVMYVPNASEDHAFVLFGLGPVVQANADPSALMRSLLEANFLSLHVHPPCFSLNPATGDAVLQCLYPMAGTAGSGGLAGLVERGVDIALRWRAGRFMDQPRITNEFA